MPALLSALLGGLTRHLLDKLLFFAAFKTLLLILVATVLPLILKNLIVWMGEHLHTATLNAAAGFTLEPQIVQLTGITAYLANCMHLPTCMTMILTALAFRAVLNFTPFMK